MIPAPARAVFEMLSERGPAPKLSREQWTELIAFTDRFQLTLHLRGVEGLPLRVEGEIAGRLAKNRARRERLWEAYGEVSQALKAAGVEFVALKGFTHETGFGIAENRLQYDLDFLCQREDRARAGRALVQAGYAPHTGKSLSPEHARPFVRPFQWKWRGDYYDPEIPIAVELHDTIWDLEPDRIRIDTAAFWSRRTELVAGGEPIPAWCEADRLGFAALHLLRHTLRNDARPAHAFELAQFVRERREDSGFWEEWRRLRDPGLRVLELAGLRLATEWFGGGKALRPAGGLPGKVEGWFRQFGWSPIANLMGSNKDAVWLHLALLENWRDRAAVLGRKLAPLRLPHQDANLAGRIGYHARALGPTLSRGLRWWLRRSTVSTAAQISD
ncbi:MAG TPA: nucleotidyltransferase family protein [Bryobacteraceae bacterium]|nr:nucleotidyltransferase family protein [Bryobacteraceae bacterium]